MHIVKGIDHQLKVFQEEFLVDGNRVANVRDTQSDNFGVFLHGKPHLPANIRELLQIHHSFTSYFLGDILAVHYIQTGTVVQFGNIAKIYS